MLDRERKGEPLPAEKNGYDGTQAARFSDFSDFRAMIGRTRRAVVGGLSLSFQQSFAPACRRHSIVTPESL